MVAANSQSIDDHTSQSQQYHATTVPSKVKAFGAWEHWSWELSEDPRVEKLPTTPTLQPPSLRDIDFMRSHFSAVR